jgi:hypothetical protein
VQGLEGSQAISGLLHQCIANELFRTYLEALILCWGRTSSGVGNFYTAIRGSEEITLQGITLYTKAELSPGCKKIRHRLPYILEHIYLIEKYMDYWFFIPHHPFWDPGSCRKI